MEVVVKENIANKPMNYPPYVVGVISAPDSHYQPILYSDYKTTLEHSALERDIYEKTKKEKPIDRKRTPKAVFVILAAVAGFGGWKALKKFVFKK